MLDSDFAYGGAQKSMYSCSAGSELSRRQSRYQRVLLLVRVDLGSGSACHRSKIACDNV